MKRLMFVFGALLWAVVVFVVTLFVTFPSQVVADRIRYEIPNLLGKEYTGDVGSVRPWWVGLSASDIKVYKETRAVRRSGDDEAPPEEGPQLVALLSKVSLRVSPWSLFRRAPYVSGSVKLTEGRVDYAVGTAVDSRGEIILADLVLGAEAMPLSDLFVLAPEIPVTAAGTVDLDLDIHAGENGMRDASGRVTFGGKNLTLSDIELPMLGALGVDVPISDLVLTADVVDGVATISSGKLQSDLANVEISGTVTLRDPIDRSAVDVQIVLSNLGEALTPFAGFMNDAKQGDAYHYSCHGALSRLGANSCSSGTRERKVTSRPIPGTPSTPIRSATGSTGSTGSTPGSARDAETDDERERRRDEIRERLRQKREERDAERSGTPPTPDEPDEEDPELTDEENVEEEEPIDEGEEMEEPLE